MHRYVDHVMGLPISLALRGPQAGGDEAQRAWAEVMRTLRAVDRVFSTYRHESFVSRLDRVEVSVADGSPELAEVLALGRQAEEESGGAFSVRRAGAGGRVRLDPSGVVKGWALDRAAVALRRLDGTDFCLSGGGDLLCLTRHQDSSPWRIGIEHPQDPSRLVAVVPVRNGAVATSGTAHRGAHLVDARTGEPPAGIGSVTVLAPTLTLADIDATAAYAQGRGAARWLQGRLGRKGLVVWADGSTTLVDAAAASPAAPARLP